jgi:hypothetical protein
LFSQQTPLETFLEDSPKANYRAIGSTTVNVVPSPTVLCTKARKRAFIALNQIFG